MLEFFDVVKKTTIYGARLRAFREAAGLSQKELCARSGVGTTTLSGIENDGKDAQVSTLSRLADCLGIRLDDIMSEEGEKPTTLLLADVIRELTSMDNSQLRDVLLVLSETISDIKRSSSTLKPHPVPKSK